MGDVEMQQKMLERIQARRATINNYINQAEPRAERLTNLAIICSAIAAALTAGPAFGGENFTETVQSIFNLPSDSTVWRSLCFLALIVSVVAAVSTNMYKSHDMATRIAKAQTSNALLAGLEASLEVGQIPVADAAKQYQQYVADVAFVPEK